MIALAVIVSPLVGEDRPQHPRAADLSLSAAERIQGIQSDESYRDVRAAYLRCMRDAYPDFSGVVGDPVRLDDGTSWPPAEGQLLSAGQSRLLDAAADCQHQSGYTALLDRYDAPSASSGFVSERTAYVWRCLRALGWEIAEPSQDGIAAPPEALTDMSACREEWDALRN